jgi:IS30 family transposase
MLKNARGRMKCTRKKEKDKEVPRNSVTMGYPQLNRNEGSMGRKKLSIENASRHSHFTWEERLQPQYYHNGVNGYPHIRSARVLGTLLGKDESTIRRELKRGMVEHTKTDLSLAWEYNAEHATIDAHCKGTAKGPQPKLGADKAFIGRVAHLIRNERHSPYAVIAEFNNHGWPSELRVCEKTLYNYIQRGYLDPLCEGDLLLGGKRRKGKGEPRRHMRADAAAKGISKRPEQADMRAESGHWEGDTVVSGSGTSTTCLMTLTERKTRFGITRRLPNRTAEAFCKELDVIERQRGASLFRKMYGTVTVDNGSEFSDIDGLEGPALGSKQRLALCFAHPYSSFERGTNENHNGIIRRFIPKGSDIGTCTKQEVRSVQEWMNTYPRKILGGLTPMMALQAELGPELCLPGILEGRR